MGALARDRYEEIGIRLSNFEAAERHKVSYSRFMDFTKQHKEVCSCARKVLRQCSMTPVAAAHDRLMLGVMGRRTVPPVWQIIGQNENVDDTICTWCW